MPLVIAKDIIALVMLLLVYVGYKGQPAMTGRMMVWLGIFASLALLAIAVDPIIAVANEPASVRIFLYFVGGGAVIIESIWFFVGSNRGGRRGSD